MDTKAPFKDFESQNARPQRLSKKKKKKKTKKKNEEEEEKETMTGGSALATSASVVQNGGGAKKSHEKFSRTSSSSSSCDVTTVLKPHRRPTSKVTRGQREICASNAEDELYVPPGGSIVDASGYEIFSSATGDVRSNRGGWWRGCSAMEADPFKCS